MTPLGKRIAASAGLSAFFLAVYGTGEAVSSARAHVPSFYYPWERHVPFVAAAIVPYLSIDLFFVAAPLLVRTDRALRAYALRVLAAIAVAGVFFVAMPLKFAFARPEVPGVFGFLHRQFLRMDVPFNELPSLHVALLVIVGDVFVRATRGPVRVAIVAWFCLIAASPLLVYQHHVVDLVAGLALGLMCLTAFPDQPPAARSERNTRVALYYAAGALATVAACLCVGRASWPLWWPALSLTVVAAGYGFVGPAIYVKRDGRLGWTTRLLLGPTLLGQHASLHGYARGCRPYDAVTDRLWIGRKLSGHQAAAARAAGVGAVVDLTCEFTESAAFRAGPYLHLPTLDLTAPTPEHVDRAVAFVREHQADSIVYVHCKVGYSRTAVVAAAVLLDGGRATSADDAVALLRRARPSLIVRPEARRAIEAYHRRLLDRRRTL